MGYIVGNRINKRIQKDKIGIDMIFNNNERLNSILNANLEDAYDNVGIFVKDIKLKAICFPKKSQKKINKYLVEHKKIVKTSSIINLNWQVKSNDSVSVTMNRQSNAMQNKQNDPNINGIKICPRCGFKNNSQAVTCRNCTARL